MSEDRVHWRMLVTAVLEAMGSSHRYIGSAL
jgi:hypothetical protein